MKQFSIVVPIVVLMIPLVYLAMVYGSLPESVPTHFTIDGTPDGYSNRSTLIFLILFLSAIGFGVYLLLANIQKIDPKRAANQSRQTMQKLAVAVVLLLTVINTSIVYAALHNGFAFNKIMLPLFGLFFAFIGNLMTSLKPNYFVGIRTPWTLENEETWRKTHRLAGKLWFVGGLLITILTLAAPARPAFIIMIVLITMMTIIPVFYSYRYFKSHGG